MSNAPVVLVDVSNAAFRSHFAYRSLSYEGKPTGMIYGVLRMVHELRENVSRRIIFCWDHGVPVPGAAKPKNWRDDVVAKYKANRNHNDEERRLALAQMPGLFECLTNLGYSSVSVLGLEADDIIGVLSRELVLQRREEVLIFSTDKDFYQLLSPSVKVLVPHKEKKAFRRITQEDVESEYAIPVSRWAEYLALGGDSCDNIKPMRGMGPKTAIKLIQDGVTLWNNRPFKGQSPDFKAKYGKYEPVWDEILKAYYAARIPCLWNDPRILSCVQRQGEVPRYYPDPHWPSEEVRRASQENLIKFLAERNMVSLIALRHKLFEITDKAQLQCHHPPTPTPLPPPKVLPKRPRQTLI